MPAIHHVITGQGRPSIFFIHGFGCAYGDWDTQVAHFAPRHLTVAVDLRGHGASPGTPDVCSIERYGADVAEVMQTLALPPAVLVGHSMGCRVVAEAAMQAISSVAGVVLIDGSHFPSAMEATLSVSQNTPYLEMLRANIPAISIETMPDTGHFPQIDEPVQTNALIDSFMPDCRCVERACPIAPKRATIPD